MQNHLVQNLCCIVGLPNFGAESLLYQRRQTFILPKMACRLAKKKWKIIWCRISVVSSVSQILVQNLCCFALAPPPRRAGGGATLDTFWATWPSLAESLAQIFARTHARTHATQTQTRNTISRLGDPRRIHPPNLRYTYKRP